MSEVKQLDFEGNHREPPRLPAEPDGPPYCSAPECGETTEEVCESCGQPLCDDCECPSCVRCAYCEVLATHEHHETHGMVGDAGSEHEGQPLCETCYCEARIAATIMFSDDSEYPAYISDTRNDTEGVFTVRWVSTDAWRGHYRADSETWEQVHNDCALAYSRDEENLASFDELLRGLLDEHGIPWARVICGTSNVFSAGYELWIPKDHRADYDTLIDEAKQAAEKELRDPADFTTTALTGRDPEDCDDEDRLFALVGSVLLAGSR